MDFLNKKDHLTIEGLRKFVNIKASMNNGLTDGIKTDFPDIVPVLREKTDSKGLNPNGLEEL